MQIKVTIPDEYVVYFEHMTESEAEVIFTDIVIAGIKQRSRVDEEDSMKKILNILEQGVRVEQNETVTDIKEDATLDSVVEIVQKTCDDVELNLALDEFMDMMK